MSESLLELQELKKYFPVSRGMFRSVKGYVRAVDGVSLKINRGESFGLVGQSGSGKTTLGRLILRLMDADDGEIIFRGEQIANLTDKKLGHIRKAMQMVFQDPFSSLDPRFNVEEIISEGIDYKTHKTLRQRRARVEELLGLVGLSSGVAARFPHEFSGGERQRIAIARSLASNPCLLILDEAVSSLDVLTQAQILRLLSELKVRLNLTYLFISHNLRVLRKVCRQIAVLYKGKVIEMGPAGEIFDNPLHPYTRELLFAAMDFKVMNKNSQDFFEDKRGCCYNKICGKREDICFEAEAQLKEVTTAHFVRCHFDNPEAQG